MGSIMLGYVKRSLPLRRTLVLLFLVLLSVLLGYGIYNCLKKELRIIDGDKNIFVKTMGEDIETAMNQLGINVGLYDYVSSPLTTKLSNDSLQELLIKRAVPVNIILEGKTTEIMTYYDTVGETIAANGIVLGPLDRIDGRSLNDPIQIGMDIKIIRVREEVHTEYEEIPYTIVQTPNDEMNHGEKKVVQEGENGTIEKYYKLTYEDGRIVSRSYLSERVAKEPIDELVELGTVPNFKTSRGEVVRYTKVLEMEATAYTSSFEDTGKHPDHPEFGICYTGMKAREGIIAVDPKVIPLYTRLYVEVIGSAPDYGFCIAGDIGSGIKGKQVDLYFDSESAVKKWGRRQVRVYILKEQKDSRWKENNYTSTHGQP